MAETVNFIDFDFCAYNYQAYDIARHFCDYAGNGASVSLFYCYPFMTLSNLNKFIWYKY